MCIRDRIYVTNKIQYSYRKNGKVLLLLNISFVYYVSVSKIIIYSSVKLFSWLLVCGPLIVEPNVLTEVAAVIFSRPSVLFFWLLCDDTIPNCRIYTPTAWKIILLKTTSARESFNVIIIFCHFLGYLIGILCRIFWLLCNIVGAGWAYLSLIHI